ncbi:unnamed protein product [Caretta caretta]
MALGLSSSPSTRRAWRIPSRPRPSPCSASSCSRLTWGAPRSWSRYEPFTAAPAGTGTHASCSCLRTRRQRTPRTSLQRCSITGGPTAGASPSASGTGPVPRQVLQSLKWAMQPAVTGISLSWDLPPGMQAELLHWDPEVIFAGQRCLVYAQLRGLPQPPDIPMGGITLQYRIQDQTYKETLQFSLQPQDGDRLPVQRLAAKSLLLELEGAVGTGSEGDGRWAVEASLSLGVVCSLTAYVGVDMERGQLVQGLLVRRDVPLAAPKVQRRPSPPSQAPVLALWPPKAQPPHPRADSPAIRGPHRRRHPRKVKGAGKRAPEESPLLRLVSLQNANVWWNLDPHLAAVLGVSETDARGRIPSVDVTPSIWATVLSMVWLHGQAVGQRDESSCWRPRLWAGCGTEQVQTRAGQTFCS